MNILIFGGSGFIGSNLCRSLSLKSVFDFLIADLKISPLFPNKTIVTDISLPFDFDFTFDCIINLAAEHRDDVLPRDLYDRVNIDGAINVCNYARKHNISKIIFTSSVAVYGFAPLGTDENGKISPFNDYGRTKWEAEKVYRKWLDEDPQNRTLVIIRPTVVFGEGNRGNVHNLFKQIVSGRFIMIGNGQNRKSIAYVQNLSAFIEHSLFIKRGIYTFNYVDKPDFTMDGFVSHINALLGRPASIKFRLPFFVGLFIGYIFDFFSKVTGKQFSISAIRVRKFCSDSVYDSSVSSTGFTPPVGLSEAIKDTLKSDFLKI